MRITGTWTIVNIDSLSCARYSPSEWSEWKLLSCVWLFATPWTIQFMEFSRPEYWGGWPFPSPGCLPNSGIKPRSPTLQADSSPAEPPGKPYTLLSTWQMLTHLIPVTQWSKDSYLHFSDKVRHKKLRLIVKGLRAKKWQTHALILEVWIQRPCSHYKDLLFSRST